MTKILLVLFSGMILIGCQKDSGSSSNNNNDNNNNDSGGNATSGTTTHSCGAVDVHNPNKTYGTVKDIDGNTYKTIQIGTQTWMAENLKTTKYRNSVSIPNITDNTEWKNNTTGAYCSYNNNTTNDCPYGKLYNWYAVNNSNAICPTGWHIPTYAEWTALVIFLGGDVIAGGKMKATGTLYWQIPNTDATNSSGFSGLPNGGRRNFDGTFQNIGYSSGWWTSNDDFSFDDLPLGLSYNDAYVDELDDDKALALSVRCVRD